MVIFSLLENWLTSDYNNFMIFIGLGSLISMISIIAIMILKKRIVSKDEKKSIIDLKVTSYMYNTILIYLGLYILWLPEFTPVNKQLIILGFIISIVAGAISYFIIYVKQIKRNLKKDKY